MTLAVTYSKRAERDETSSAVVTVETDSIEFDEKGRVSFREAPSGKRLRLDPVYVIEITSSDGGQWL